MVMFINPSKQKLRAINLPSKSKYHIIIPLKIEGLPTWIQLRSTKERWEVPWKKGSVVYMNEKIDFMCSDKGGGLFILIGGEIE